MIHSDRENSKKLSNGNYWEFIDELFWYFLGILIVRILGILGKIVWVINGIYRNLCLLGILGNSDCNGNYWIF